MQFDPSILANHPQTRDRLLSVLEAALEAVEPYAAVRNCFVRTGTHLQAGSRSYALDRFRQVLILGAGKAGAPMARAVEDVLEDRCGGGQVVVKHGHGGPTRRVLIVEAGHPVPDAAGLAAGRKALEIATAAGADDLVIVVLSGGGSALLEALDGLTLADLQATTATLLACGATINEINCLRKHLSALKGGQLARALYPATVITLVLSDVVGSPLDVIASGPTVPDASTWQDAWAVVAKYDLASRLPTAVIARLESGRSGRLPETPKQGDSIFDAVQTVIVGDNRIAAEAACARAEALGVHALLLSTFMEGEAGTIGKVAVALAKEVVASGLPAPAPACLVLGGESTVTLGAAHGLGGRNQEAALAAALALNGAQRITVAALATDGSDGPTDSAGAIVDGGTVGRGQMLGLDAAQHLATHNAYPYLKQTGDLLISGPTQTNVNDLLVIWVDGEEPTGERE